MKELKMNTDGVVIGSGSIEEMKYHTIAFMERVYFCIVEDRDYRLCGYSNLGPWTQNLLYYIKKLDEMKKYRFGYVERSEELISAIRCNLEALDVNDSEEHKKTVKNLCLNHWENLLKHLTSSYHLVYKRID